MSYHRERTPGAWVLGATISADELNALDRDDFACGVRITASGADTIASAFAPLIEACGRAQSRIDRPRPDVCHHCGAPSPGDVCRYCNTAHRRTT